MKRLKEDIHILMSFGLEESIAQEVLAKYSHSDLDAIISFLNNYGLLERAKRENERLKDQRDFWKMKYQDLKTT
jgi:hypothetical protein